MKCKKITAAALIAVMLFASACSSTEDTDETTTETYNRADIKDIRAQDDFYGYMNLDTLKSLEIEPGHISAGPLTENTVDEDLKEVVLDIVKSDKKYEEGSCEQVLKRAYDDFVDFENNDSAKKAAADEINGVLADITAVKDVSGLFELMSKLYPKYGARGFLYMGVDQDVWDPEKYSVMFSANPTICGADLEELSKDPNKGLDYEKGIITALQVSGKSYDDAEAIAKDLMRILIDVSRHTDFEIQNADNPYIYVEVLKKEELDKLFANHTTDEFEKIAGIKENPYGTWNTLNIDQLVAIDSYLTDENIESFKAWLICDFLTGFGSFIVDDNPLLRPYVPNDAQPLDDRAYDYLKQDFKFEVSDVLVKYCYDDKDEEILQRMLADLMDSYRDLIGGADWLSEETRKSLIEKLEGIQFITPGSVKEEIKNDPSRNDVFGADRFETTCNCTVKDQNENIALLGSKRDRNKQVMPMQTMNACYTNDNKVTICVAIMTDPWFDSDKDYYTNLGGLGVVLGHEIGHAFDSNNITYNVNGVYDPTWISEKDLEALEKRNEEAISYFEDNFTVYGIYHVDGQQTLGENYADLGGVEAVVNACDSEDQLKKVFESYGTLWCLLQTEDDVIDQIDDDVHSPGIIRTNAILATIDEFYEVYDVKEGDGMYISPDKRIGRWR